MDRPVVVLVQTCDGQTCGVQLQPVMARPVMVSVQTCGGAGADLWWCTCRPVIVQTCEGAGADL